MLAQDQINELKLEITKMLVTNKAEVLRLEEFGRKPPSYF